MTSYRPQIEAAAATYGLSANLVEAVVLAESSGHTDAFRFEPSFYDRYLKDNPVYAGQIPRRISSSYGLMQCMFSTAQDHGFRGQPEELFLPEVGLAYGCKHLSAMLAWAHGAVRQALAAYNGGIGNWRGAMPQRYAGHVLDILTTVDLEHPVGDLKA